MSQPEIPKYTWHYCPNCKCDAYFFDGDVCMSCGRFVGRINARFPTHINRSRIVCTILKMLYPETRCALNYRTPFQLLVSTVLAAQCTDVRVNQVTKSLFAHCPTPFEFNRLTLSDLEQIIRSTGFYRNKAKNLKALCQILIEQYDGVVPTYIDQLISLPGVGRKTANVVLGTAFGIASGVVVDTHVKRLSNRLGLTTSQNPVVIERDLMRQLPKNEWIDFSHRMICHGRKICKARNPNCLECAFSHLCLTSA